MKTIPTKNKFYIAITKAIYRYRKRNSENGRGINLDYINGLRQAREIIRKGLNNERI